MSSLLTRARRRRVIAISSCVCVFGGLLINKNKIPDLLNRSTRIGMQVALVCSIPESLASPPKSSLIATVLCFC